MSSRVCSWLGRRLTLYYCGNIVPFRFYHHCASLKPFSGGENKVVNLVCLKRYCTAKSSHGKLPLKTKPGQYRAGPVTWKVLAIVACAGAGAVYFVRKEIEKKESEMNRIQTIGKMAVGGPWEGLVDHTGKTRSSEDFKGQWLYMYFGFTHCPDVCPDELEKIVNAVDIVDTLSATKVQPLFITIDPSRDTPDKVAAYIKEFSPKLLGLTGERDKITQVARLYRIYSSEGPKDVDDDYIVDHSIITYLINPDGECVTFFSKNQNATQVANTTAMQMKEWEVTHKS